MTSVFDAGADGSEDAAPLPPEEALDEGEIGDLLDEGLTGDYLDEGYSPAERPWGVETWGVTPREAASHEDLEHRLARETRDVAPDDESDGLGDAPDTDGELIDDEVGDLRAGRLIARSEEDGGQEGDADYWARDVGEDGGAASAEEAAVHVVPDPEGPDGSYRL